MLLRDASAWVLRIHREGPRPSDGCKLAFFCGASAVAASIIYGLNHRDPSKSRVFHDEETARVLRSTKAWHGLDGEAAFRAINASGSGKISLEELQSAYAQDCKQPSGKGLSSFTFAEETRFKGWLARVGILQDGDFSKRNVGTDHQAASLLNQFDADQDGGLRRHEFAALLRQWNCRENNAPLSNGSLRTTLRRMMWSCGVMSTTALSLAPGFSFVYNMFPVPGATALCWVAGGALLATTMLAFTCEPPVITRPPDDDDALVCVQPEGRFYSCAGISIAGGMISAPLYVLLDHFDTSSAHQNTLYWQFVLAPMCSLMGAACFFELRDLAAKVAVRYRPTPKPTMRTLCFDTVMTMFSGVAFSFIAGAIAHACGAPWLRNMLLAPGAMAGAFDPTAPANQKHAAGLLFQAKGGSVAATPGSWLEYFVGPGPKNLSNYVDTIDPVSLAGGDSLYITTLIILGGVVSYHTARAWWKHAYHGDPDHLAGALDLIIDLLKLLKMVFKVLKDCAVFLFKEAVKKVTRQR